MRIVNFASGTPLMIVTMERTCGFVAGVGHDDLDVYVMLKSMKWVSMTEKRCYHLIW